MLKNEISITKNQKIKIPLIERIIVCGIQKKQLNEIKPSIISNEESLIEYLSNLNLEILEEYTSSMIKKDESNAYILNIPKYSIPFGLSPKIIKSKSTSKYEGDKKIVSFSLVEDTKLKHCSSLSFYDFYKISNKDILIKKSITLVSSKDYYHTQKKILEYIYKILLNYYTNKNTNSNLVKKICYENYFSHEKIFIEEYSLLSFYFSFILNSWDVNPSNNKLIRSFHTLPLNSENNDDFFMKIFINDKTPFPIRDYNISIILDKFHMDDLIIIYQSLLMEYEIILIFNNFEEINYIIYSLLSLIYPLKWKFPITSFLLPETEVMLDAPFATIIGVHESFKYLIEYKIKKECFNLETTIIYDLIEKKFVLKDPNFPVMDNKLMNNIKSSLYFLKADLLQFKHGTIKINNSLMKLFDKNEKIVNKIEYKKYLNIKIISIFFNVFIDLIKNFKSCIKYEEIEKNKISIKTSEPNDFFDFNKFEQNFPTDITSTHNQFFLNFSKTLMFSNFVRSFIRYQSTKKIYIFINELVTKLSEKELTNQKRYLNTIFDKYIKTTLSCYYLIKYINLNYLLNNYFMKGINFNEFIQNDNRANELWNSVDKKNIKFFSENMLNTYYSNILYNSKTAESFIDSITLIGINSTISSNGNMINDTFNSKIKENDDMYKMLKDSIDEKKMGSIINIRNTGHHKSSSSMNEKIFQQQKFEMNLNFDLINQNNNIKNKEQNEPISSVNTYSKGNINNNINNNLDNKKKISQKQKGTKPLRINYNSLTNVIQGAMAKHAGDEDDIINIPDDF